MSHETNRDLADAVYDLIAVQCKTKEEDPATVIVKQMVTENAITALTTNLSSMVPEETFNRWLDEAKDRVNKYVAEVRATTERDNLLKKLEGAVETSLSSIKELRLQEAQDQDSVLTKAEERDDQ